MNESDLRLCLARAIWRVENDGKIPETAEEISAAFLKEKEKMLIKAIKVMRHLENQRITLAPIQI